MWHETAIALGFFIGSCWNSLAKWDFVLEIFCLPNHVNKCIFEVIMTYIFRER